MRTNLWQFFILLGSFALAHENSIAAPMENGGSKLGIGDAQDGWKQEVTETRSIVWQTMDSGRHWTDVSPSPLIREVKKSLAGNMEDLDSIAALCPITGQQAWLAIRSGRKLLMEYTSDAGRHWKEASSTITADAVSISFLDDTRGFLLASSSPAAGLMRKTVYGTEDGGRHWRLLAAPNAGSYYTTGISFRSPSDGWITGTYHGGDDTPLYRTSDGGKSWRIQTLRIPASFRGGYANTYPPLFIGKGKKRGWMPVKLVRREPAPDHESWVNYVSEDGGETWHLHKLGVMAASPPG
jgi:photosystem II stability/assembly factor-like uncharacterized protein